MFFKSFTCRVSECMDIPIWYIHLMRGQAARVFARAAKWTVTALHCVSRSWGRLIRAEPAKNLRCHARMTRQWGTPHGYFQGNMIHDGIWGSSIFRHTHVDMVVLNSMMFGPEKSLRGSVWGTVRQAELSCCPPLFGPREPANDILVFNNIYIP